jgi:hypothetical protein
MTDTHPARTTMDSPRRIVTSAAESTSRNMSVLKWTMFEFWWSEFW